ncbi:MAG TPA: FAD-dependent oxidoreductase [Thermoanaerobaculia bacterium]|nr:FAD-dependent oxidoreductase [Thermoanaerobaculia bacterium]
MRTDVAVVGGGPAGAALAISVAGQGRGVVIIESSDYSAIRAGETLQPASRALIEKLGVWERFLDDAHVSSHGVASAWGSDELQANDFFVAPRGNGWHLDRSRFDHMLASEAERRGATLLTNARVAGIERIADGWRITTRAGACIDCTIVIDATGRRASVARRLGIRRRAFDQLAGVFGVIANSDPVASSFTIIEAVRDGWWYAAQIPRDRVAVAFMSDIDVIRREGMRDAATWMTRLRETRHVNKRAAGSLAQPLSMQAAGSTILDRVTGEGWLAIGDAASAYDPLSSQGIHKALATAEVAAWAIANENFDEYERTVRAAFDDYLAARATFYAGERRWPSSLFWARRQRRLVLDPRRTIGFDGNAPSDDRMALIEPQLSVAELRSLCAACSPPRPAHEIVAAFRAATAGAHGDDTIVLALQALVREGIVRIV